MHEDCQTVRNRDFGTRDKQRLSTVSRVPCSHDPSGRATGGRSLRESRQRQHETRLVYQAAEDGVVGRRKGWQWPQKDEQFNPELKLNNKLHSVNQWGKPLPWPSCTENRWLCMIGHFHQRKCWAGRGLLHYSWHKINVSSAPPLPPPPSTSSSSFNTQCAKTCNTTLLY